jgi:hypothetical protein
MSNALETIMPILVVGGGMSIPIFYFYFESRNKASRDRVIEKAVESGAPLEDVKHIFADQEAQNKSVRKMPFRKGLILMALGGGMLLSRELGFFGPSGSEEAGLGGVFGICGLLLGAAIFVSDFFNRKRF